MKFGKKRKSVKNILKKISKKCKKATKCVKYKKIKYSVSFAKLLKMMSSFSHIYPEFVLLAKINELTKANSFCDRKLSGTFRYDKSLIVEKYARQVLKKCLSGAELKVELVKLFKSGVLYKKEIAVFRKVFAIVIMSEIYEREKLVYMVKKDVFRGKHFIGNLSSYHSPGFYYGLVKNKNLGLYLSEKKEILNGIDLLVIDLDLVNREFQILINLLIKCL